ncbi:unnamed protein product, partial [marine sediment metagenome]
IRFLPTLVSKLYQARQMKGFNPLPRIRFFPTGTPYTPKKTDGQSFNPLSRIRFLPTQKEIHKVQGLNKFQSPCED